MIGEVGENGIEPIGFGVVEECPGADEVETLFEEFEFEFGVLADVADSPVGEAAAGWVEGFEEAEAEGFVTAGGEAAVVVEDDREEVFFFEAIVGAVLVYEAADGGDDRVRDEAAQAEVSDRVLAVEELCWVFGVGLEVSIGSRKEDGFRSSGGGEALEGGVGGGHGVARGLAAFFLG